MTPRDRVSEAVGVRIAEMGLTVPQVSKLAGVHPTTMRAFIKGLRWPSTTTLDRIAAALGWDELEMARQAVDGDDRILRAVPTAALIGELQRRCTANQL